MANKQRKTIVLSFDDRGVTEPVMRSMAPLSEYGVSLTDVIGQAADCVLSPRYQPVEAHIAENIDVYHFDQSDDPIGEDPNLSIDGKPVDFGAFQELLIDGVSSVYDQVERTLLPTCYGATGSVRHVSNPPGTNRVILDVELGED